MVSLATSTDTASFGVAPLSLVAGPVNTLWGFQQKLGLGLQRLNCDVHLCFQQFKKKSKFLPFKKKEKEKSELQHSLYVRLL